LSIPFVRDIEFTYGEPAALSPLIRRVIANNPGSFTYTGTGVYIVGRGEVAVIDPGPDNAAHFDALKAALKGERVTHVFVTHSHMDHSPLAHPLAEAYGAQVYAGGPAIPTESEVRLEAGDDLSFQPDVRVRDGEIFTGPGWTIEAIATPGHTSNHFCYALKEENALFSGDHVMGWSTTVISPPDGDMGDYLASLQKVRDRGFDTLWPTHGPPVRDTKSFLQAYLDHRLRREAQIVDAIRAGRGKIPDMVTLIYKDVDRKLHPAACHSVLAHMLHLVKVGRVECSDDYPRVDSVYRLREGAGLAAE
jgi:glyoxylase-like metal-dependent hydrolase (beta-lactamase superfamily II)